MKALLLSLMLILSPLAATQGDKVFVLADSCALYEGPTYSSSQVATLEYGAELDLLDSELYDGFYHVSVVLQEQSLSGYVPADLVGEKTDEQDVILSYNGTIINKAQIFSPVDESVICTLNKGDRVFLYEGYYKEKDTLAIKFSLDGKVMYGRVKTEDVRPDGVNAALIVSITAIVAVVTIIIILMGISSKKRHKKLKKQN